MARKKTTKAAESSVVDYRYAAKRKNIPPAGLAAQGRVREAPRMAFAYDPHWPPVLRFDASGASDQLPELLELARSRPLTAEEVQWLAEALLHREPWLEWAGKREQTGVEVDPVALHIHERVSAQAILNVAGRESVQRSLFADPPLDYRQAIQGYQHGVDWANRLILGDSLPVMASLAYREGLAGKVQMIYMDPPYGIKFASKFQPEIGKRDVTRAPEMVKAYRDTWTLGVHSYLAYLRDRLILCRALLADTGSIFVQIGDENVHRVRCVMDEVFGAENSLALIAFVTTGGQSAERLGNVFDYLLWYGRDAAQVKYHQLFVKKELREGGGWAHSRGEFEDGKRENLGVAEVRRLIAEGKRVKPYAQDGLASQGATASGSEPFAVQGRSFHLPPNSHWKTTLAGMERLAQCNRIEASENSIRYVRFLDDVPVQPLTNVWDDTNRPGYIDAKPYVVQTSTKVIERCLLMTTDPGDLVFDPTCGSGTTAYVAEQWGRRWITIDTSRVAVALARQRLLTATFPFYKVKNAAGVNGGTSSSDQFANPAHGFEYKKVPHITLKSIAQNVALDAIFARHHPILDETFAVLNAALHTVTPEVRQRLAAKLLEKEKREGKKAITHADRRRWQLPKESWKEWQVPFDADEEWTPELKAALAAYRAAWRAKMDEVNACIAANAEQEELVDQPEVVKGMVRVSGPFTVEAVMPVDGEGGHEPVNADAYLDHMIQLLRGDGVRFPNNQVMRCARLEPRGGDDVHAEGEWQTENGQTRTVAVSFGPQYGPVTAFQVENALPQAMRGGFDDLVVAGCSFDAAAQAIIQDDPNPRVRCHLAHIRPDVNMGDLLKETPSRQLFTVFGSPRTELKRTKDGLFVIDMQGVDIYHPVDNTILPTNADNVAAWFVDTDDDGRTFCITQAFFPDQKAWDKLARALKGVIEAEPFAALSGTVSLPFPAGPHKRAAVKVIDPRGNEVMRVHHLGAAPYQR